MVKKNKNIAIFCGSKLGNNTIYKKEISIIGHVSLNTAHMCDTFCLISTFQKNQDRKQNI